MEWGWMTKNVLRSEADIYPKVVMDVNYSRD